LKSEVAKKSDEAAKALGYYGQKYVEALKETGKKDLARKIEALDTPQKIELLMAIEYENLSDKKKEEFIKSTAAAARTSETAVRAAIQKGEELLKGLQLEYSQIAELTAVMPEEIRRLLYRPGFFYTYESMLLKTRLMTSPVKEEKAETAPSTAIWNELRSATDGMVNSMQNFKKSIEKMMKEFPKMVKEAQAGGR
jgi:hypothetical protein